MKYKSGFFCYCHSSNTSGTSASVVDSSLDSSLASSFELESSSHYRAPHVLSLIEYQNHFCCLPRHEDMFYSCIIVDRT